MGGVEHSSVGCAFPSTDWSAVAKAAAADDPAARAALERLLARYLPALRTFLIYERRLDRHEAEDLVQGFAADRILEKNLLAEADRGRGRFRTFLLKCLTNYMSNQRRHERGQKRHPGPGKLNGVSDAWEDKLGSAAADEGGEVFELAWARQVVAEAVQRMQEDCEEVLRSDLWAIFEGRVLLPAMEGVAPLPYAQLVERFSFESVAQATNALVTAKRMYSRHLRAAVAAYCEEDEVDEELRRLRKVLARG